MEHETLIATPRTKPASCTAGRQERTLGTRDAIEVLSGKWKIQLIGALLFGGRMRFMDLLREVDGIGAKMLSKELQDLESHQLVTRTVKETKPITVEYEITGYGLTLEPVIIAIAHWGIAHRRKIIRGEDPEPEMLSALRNAGCAKSNDSDIA